MKKIISLALLVFCLGMISTEVSAQMSKKEAKVWKKRIKKLQPEDYKRLIDENTSLKNQVSSLKTELSNVDDRISEKDEQILTYQSQVKDLRNELAKAQSQQKTPVRRPATPAKTTIDESGVLFKVQIGAFKKKDIAKYADNSDNFGAEKQGDLTKYTIGTFRDYWEADTFKKYLREMGVKDAFIASYVDGSRVPIKEVLESVSKSKKS